MPEKTLKPGWKWVKFGDVVNLNTERVADPKTASIERYVGLEHITPNDLRIRNWGFVAEGTTFTNYFKPGQVLFGKRRAYQRKVAVADFAGVCSSDIYIFEPKNNGVLLPELLPFICQTEGFYDYAVGTSAGSLSPRTNWSHLTRYEFALPPLEEQQRIIKILLAIEVVLERNKSLLDCLNHLRESFSWSVLNRQHSLSKNWLVIPLGKMAEIIMGQSPPGKAYNTEGRGLPLLNGPTEFGRIHPSPVQWSEVTPRVCEPKDILFCVRGSTTGRQNIADQSYCIGRGLAAIRGIKGKSVTSYLKIVLEAITDNVFREAKGSGSTFPNITSIRLQRWSVPFPDLENQHLLASHFESILEQVNNQVTRVEAISSLKNQLIARVI